jgi:hypothetical protein
VVPKEALHLEDRPPLVGIPWLGLISRIEGIDGLLKQHPNHRTGRLEDRGAHKGFQLLKQFAAGSAGGEPSH